MLRDSNRLQPTVYAIDLPPLGARGKRHHSAARQKAKTDLAAKARHTARRRRKADSGSQCPPAFRVV